MGVFHHDSKPSIPDQRLSGHHRVEGDGRSRQPSEGTQEIRTAAGREQGRRQSPAAWPQQGGTHARRGTQCQIPPRPRSAPDRNGRRSMKSPVVKRSIVIAGHKTSVSLEDAFWKGLKDIAGGRDTTLSDLVASIDTDSQNGKLVSAIRLFVLVHYRLTL